MIQKIKNYLKKNHEANLWLEGAYARETKKQALERATMTEIAVPEIHEAVVQHPQVVFSHADEGHNQEERNRIQELYKELGDMFVPRRLAM
jgi:hypothetical protein